VDVVAGGPPCQPFSLGGKHKSYQDNRDMFPYAIRCIECLRPKAFIFENVRGLLRNSFSRYFNYIILRLMYPHCAALKKESWESHLDRLKKITPSWYCGVKYDVSYRLLNTADYGVPQKRERVIIVGLRSDLGLEWEFPRPTHTKDRLDWDKFVTGEYWDKHGLSSQADIKTSELLKTRHGSCPPVTAPWQTVRDALTDTPDPRDTHEIRDHVFKGGAKIYPGHTGSEIDQPAKAIKAGGHGVPGGENMIRYENGSVRYFTVYEAKLIQTFPEDFVVMGAWGEAMRQIGNAVPVKLAEVIGRQLIGTLNAPPSPRPVAKHVDSAH